MSVPTLPGITTVDSAKKFLNITDTNSDSILADLVSGISKQIETDCNRVFSKKDYTEYYDGEGSDSLPLRQYPINSITSIHDDIGRDYGASSLIDADDYAFDAESGIVKFDYPLACGKNNVKVVYSGGYENIPSDLELAANYLVAAEFKRSRTEVNTPEGQEAKERNIESLEKKAEKIIDKYRRPSNGR